MFLWIAIFATYVVVLNFSYAALQVWLLRRRQLWLRWMGVAAFGWAFLMSGLFLLQACQPPAWAPFMRDWLYFPLAVEMVWNVLLLQVLVLVMIVAALIVCRLDRVPRPQPLPRKGMSRRKFLYLLGYGAVPATALGMGVHGALSRDDLRVREFDIPINGLPPELEGFRIAHVSDLHSGLFVGPRRLKIMTDAANDLKADLVAVTGDLINREMREFPAALAAIQQIESPYGTYLCEGNHDVIPGPGLIVEACAANGLPMLYNTGATLSVQGRSLFLAGLPWVVNDPGTPPQVVARLFPPREEGDVRILLAHHPHVFDFAQDADLLLSGHTHGGQIMFGGIGLGDLRFKYCSGRFHRGNTTMIVSNGCGDWFPCRIGAPAEIGLLRLTKA